MKRIALIGLALISCLLALSEAKRGGTVNVKGYTRKDGTVVAPYTRNAPGTGSSTDSVGTGVKCGNSYISAADTCHIGTAVVTDTTFNNCTEARAAGFHDILANEPGYSDKLDRDNDGIACESGGSDDSGSLYLDNQTDDSVGFTTLGKIFYDPINDFAALPVQCLKPVSYDFQAQAPFKRMNFDLDGWPSGDVLDLLRKYRDKLAE